MKSIYTITAGASDGTGSQSNRRMVETHPTLHTVRTSGMEDATTNV